MDSLSRDILCLGICSDFIFPQLGNMSLSWLRRCNFNRKYIGSIKVIHIKLDGWYVYFQKFIFQSLKTKGKEKNSETKQNVLRPELRLSMQCSEGGSWYPETRASAPGVRKRASSLHLFLPDYSQGPSLPLSHPPLATRMTFAKWKFIMLSLKLNPSITL